MDKIEELIERCHSQWKKKYGALSIRESTKFVKGKDTGEPSITFYVLEKVSVSFLPKGYKIPAEIDGVPTDVVELSARDYEIGETTVSKETPEEQRRRASGVR